MTTLPHTGTRAAQTIVSHQWLLYINQTVSVAGNTSYGAEGWIRTQNVAAGAQIVLEWRDAANAIIRTDLVGTLTGTANWTQYVATVTSPANATSVVFALNTLIEADKNGTAWFDDLVFYAK